MPTLQVHFWAENAGAGVSQLAAETLGIWQDKGGLTTQCIDNKLRECVWESAQSISRFNKQHAGHKQRDLLIDLCITQFRGVKSKRLLRKRYMADKTNLDGQKLKAALDEFVEVGLHRRKNRLEQTPRKNRQLVHVGMYCIALMRLLLFLMMCRSRRRRKRYLRSQVFADNGVLRHLEQLPGRAI
jgi:hypothetical protein